jgi:transcriptional regulator GlxA family with amidase domain
MRIAILAPPGVQSLDVVGPAEVFWEASRRRQNPGTYDLTIIGASAEPVRGTGGLRLVPDATIDDPDVRIDTLLVGGDPTLPPVDRKIIEWIARRAPQARRYGSICTGAFLLAEAGLLDGRRVTTHWETAPELARRYPRVIVEPDRIFLRDGSLCTAAGVSAGMDLALALVEEDFGRDLALAVARYMVLFLKRPGGQSQFSAHLLAQTTEKSQIREAQEYVLEHLADDLTVDHLARHAGMSPRNFTRTFHRETGTTPADFIRAARIDAARRLLEDSSLPLKTLAFEIGFGTLGAMRRAFTRSLGVGPQDYRLRFQSTAGRSVDHQKASRSSMSGASERGEHDPRGDLRQVAESGASMA